MLDEHCPSCAGSPGSNGWTSVLARATRCIPAHAAEPPSSARRPGAGTGGRPRPVPLVPPDRGPSPFALRVTSGLPCPSDRPEAAARMLAVRRLIPFLLLGPFVLGSSAPHVQVVLSGDVHVRRGEVSRDVVVVHGSADVDGTVQGSVVVFDGPVTIAGSVRGDVAALDGTVTLLRGSHVTGDVWVG